jgi:hypothetical protein
MFVLLLSLAAGPFGPQAAGNQTEPRWSNMIGRTGDVLDDFGAEASMMGPWRQLALAAALNVTLGIGVGTAQTVMVRNAPPGSTVELVLNVATIGSATVSPAGEATLAIDLAAHGGKQETDAYLHVDVCGTLYRVLFAERGQLPPPQGESCSKRESLGLFLVRRVTSFVVDVSGPSPTARLRQGPVPAEWLAAPEERVGPAPESRPSPKGVVLFGGGGFGKVSNALAVTCGSVEGCKGDDFRLAYTAGAALWITRFLAVEGSYLKPSDVIAEGSGSTYRFKSFLDTDVLTISGKVALPLHIVRIYVQGGANYHQGVFSTTQTIDDSTYTTDDVTETIDDVTVTTPGVTVTTKGGTQTLQLRTAGWGWLFGGGIEIWVAPKFAIYAEVSRMKLRGDSRDGAEGGIDDRLTTMLIGGRIRIGR